MNVFGSENFRSEILLSPTSQVARKMEVGRRRIMRISNPEISEMRVSLLIKNNVLGLDIAMDDVS